MQPSQVMTSLKLDQILIKFNKKKISQATDFSRIRHNHTPESMKARLGWTINKHGGQRRKLREMFHSVTLLKAYQCLQRKR